MSRFMRVSMSWSRSCGMLMWLMNRWWYGSEKFRWRVISRFLLLVVLSRLVMKVIGFMVGMLVLVSSCSRVYSRLVRCLGSFLIM